MTPPLPFRRPSERPEPGDLQHIGAIRLTISMATLSTVSVALDGALERFDGKRQDTEQVREFVRFAQQELMREIREIGAQPK